MDREGFDGARETCDLVMKGGITSGVVYPGAMVELARKYRFKNIGGTSAGAIAAAFAASAEFNRNGHGFQTVQELPAVLAEHLKDLFQPLPEHQKTFDLLLRYLDGKLPLPGQDGAGTARSIWRGIKLLLPLRTLAKTVKRIPQTDFGLCNGMTQPGQDFPALTDWLNTNLEACAGRLSSDALPEVPLTFGMLHEAGISLRTMTTDLSRRRPLTLPNIPALYLRGDDIDRLFPANVAQYLRRKPHRRVPDLFQIPRGDKMPVIVAVRMSLSFPVLLTAVPVYQFDHSLRLCPDKMREPQLSWFSDGGIASNFPIHLFDDPFPRRPTFALSLEQFNPCRQPEDGPEGAGENRVFLPRKPNEGMQTPLYQIASLPEFLGAILDSAKDWQDAVQSSLVGYRERIVRVALKGDEGGINLDMEPARVTLLNQLGHLAGREITGTNGGEPFDFDEHRWRRALSAYIAIEEAFDSVVEGERAETGRERFGDFLDRIAQNPDLIKHYQPNADDLATLIHRLRELFDLAAHWEDMPIRDEIRADRGEAPPLRPALRFFPREFVSHD